MKFRNLLLIFFSFFFLILFILFSGSTSSPDNMTISDLNLPESVLRWKEKVTIEADKNGISDAVPFLLGIIMVETAGNSESYPDIMQCSESQGLAPNSVKDPNKSIEIGVKYFSDMRIRHTLHDILNIVQAYNFGEGYLDSAPNEYTLQAAINFSKKQAHSKTTSYDNPIAIKLGYDYRYSYGNMFYAQLVKQYIESHNNENLVGDGEYIFPVDDPVITSPYGGRLWDDGSYEFHRGLDFGNPSGTSIKAISSGKVVRAEFHYSWGNHVVIQHGDGKVSLYAHQSKMLVNVGDIVKTGQVIGKIGSTGNSTGPHLHLEVSSSMDLSENNLMDPMTVIKKGIK